jgi:hypothetical protein
MNRSVGSCAHASMTSKIATSLSPRAQECAGLSAITSATD